ncbi:transketolase [Pseudoalteromonas sp. S4498]|uniref:transketolase family protein n=1 Tax=Pseudoalteromonas TaxID=53246 RepID=UPI001107D5A8|nr:MULTISPECIES: transketolase C-terminal domain-containing protein [Pseudoalteromonas]MCG9759918.1 transketolase family protein [Pseudoalteromonas sp. Isolate6]NKC19434.1 transketolase [Pseudoalteromonas galatheae]
MEITSKSARQWARLGPRGVYGQAILAIADKHDDLMVMSADLASSSGLERFRTTYPDKFLNAGIAEQNMIGVAAGLAKEGYNVFASSFSPFIAMRASEQIRMNLGYMELNVKAVAIGGGISMGFLGNSHFGIEDMAVMRAIPNLTVVSPADCVEVVKLVESAASFKGPMYIRLTGTANCPIVYTDDYEFEIGKSILLREGADVTLIACGSMVYQSLQAAELLAEQGISASVINMHTIKPLDEARLQEIIAKGRPIITVEEHSKIGGLGSAIAEYLSPLGCGIRHLSVALPDAYIKTGDYDYMLGEQGLDAKSIAQKAETFLTK